jgi:hypothetical protein
MNVAASALTVLVVDCETGDTYERPMDDREFKQWQADRATAAASPSPAASPVSQLAEAVSALETLDPTKPATIGDVVAALRALTA